MNFFKLGIDNLCLFRPLTILSGVLLLVSCSHTNDEALTTFLDKTEPVVVAKVVKTVVTDVVDCAKAKFDNCVFQRSKSESSHVENIPQGLSNEELEQYVKKHLKN